MFRKHDGREKSSIYLIQRNVLLLSVMMCRIFVTSVSAPGGQFSTSLSNSGEFIPIART